MGMRRCTHIVAVLLLATAPALARDTHCEHTRRLVVFSHTQSIATPNAAAAWCLVTEGHDLDPRIVNPGSDAVSVRYRGDVPGSTALDGTLNGLGFRNKAIRLTRAQTPLGIVYDSPIYPLPDGIASSGCVTASLETVAASNSFHTVDSACPGLT